MDPKDLEPVNTENEFEPQLLLIDKGVTILGPTRTEIAVRFCEAMIPKDKIHILDSRIPKIAVEFTDELIAELRKEKSDG